MDERNFTYMFYGFTAAWVIVVLYVLTMVRRESKLRSELERVKHMIEDREKK
jgi:CcmD family protein